MTVAEVALQCGEAALHRLAARRGEAVYQRVEHRVDRPDADEVGRLVLVVDVLAQGGQGAGAQQRHVELVNQAQGAVDQRQQRRGGQAPVVLAQRVAVLAPADGLVGLVVDLLPDLQQQPVLGGRGPGAVEPGHGQVDLPAVAPQPAGVHRRAAGQ